MSITVHSSCHLSKFFYRKHVSMPSVKTSISEAMDRVKRKNKSQLEFLLNFRDGNSGRHVMTRAEKWLQMELLYQLDFTSVKERDVFVEYPIEYRKESRLKPNKLKKVDAKNLKNIYMNASLLTLEPLTLIKEE